MSPYSFRQRVWAAYSGPRSGGGVSPASCPIESMQEPVGGRRFDGYFVFFLRESMRRILQKAGGRRSFCGFIRLQPATGKGDRKAAHTTEKEMNQWNRGIGMR